MYQPFEVFCSWQTYIARSVAEHDLYKSFFPPETILTRAVVAATGVLRTTSAAIETRVTITRWRCSMKTSAIESATVLHVSCIYNWADNVQFFTRHLNLENTPQKQGEKWSCFMSMTNSNLKMIERSKVSKDDVNTVKPQCVVQIQYSSLINFSTGETVVTSENGKCSKEIFKGGDRQFLCK